MMEIGTGTGLDAGGDDDDFSIKEGPAQSFSFPSSHLSSFIFPFFLFDETRLDNEIGNTTITNMHASFLDYSIQAN